MTVLSLVPVWFVLALLIPTAWVIGGAYRKWSGSRTVTCPETSQPATIALDARHAAAMHVLGNPVRKIQTCSRWLDRQTCDGGCLAQVSRSA